MNPPALTLKDFCDAYRVCRETAYQQIRAGRLRAVKLGRKTLILRADADAPGRRPCPSSGPSAASRRAHEPCPAQMLWAPLPLPAVAPNDVLRLASASTASIARPAPPRQRHGQHRCCRPTTANAASASFARAASSASKLSTARSARSASTGRNARPLVPLCGGRHERGPPLPTQRNCRDREGNRGGQAPAALCRPHGGRQDRRGGGDHQPRSSAITAFW
jgi:hypothetical protein